MAFIISLIINVIVVTLLAMVALLPYYILKFMVRMFLYKIGIDTFLEEEKINYKLMKKSEALTPEIVLDNAVEKNNENDPFIQLEIITEQWKVEQQEVSFHKPKRKRYGG